MDKHPNRCCRLCAIVLLLVFLVGCVGETVPVLPEIPPEPPLPPEFFLPAPELRVAIAIPGSDSTSRVLQAFVYAELNLTNLALSRATNNWTGFKNAPWALGEDGCRRAAVHYPCQLMYRACESNETVHWTLEVIGPCSPGIRRMGLTESSPGLDDTWVWCSGSTWGRGRRGEFIVFVYPGYPKEREIAWNTHVDGRAIQWVFRDHRPPTPRVSRFSSGTEEDGTLVQEFVQSDSARKVLRYRNQGRIGELRLSVTSPADSWEPTHIVLWGNGGWRWESYVGETVVRTWGVDPPPLLDSRDPR